MKIKLKKLDPKAVIPKYSRIGDAGLDFTATSHTIHPDGKTYTYGTSIAIQIPEGHVGLLFPRSSINRTRLTLSNSVGVIDSNYRGEIAFVFFNDSTSVRDAYKVGERIGQLIIVPYPAIEFEEVEELSDTVRGDQGFGSSGK